MNRLRIEGGKRINQEDSGSSPLLSIITVVYNGQDHLEQTINSVISQTFKDLEYIIVDGGSKDKTLDIIRNNDNNIDFWISEKDNGIYDAMNKGIALANGRYLLFLNADDYLVDNTVLERVIALIPAGAGGYCGHVNFIDRNGNILHRKAPKKNDPFSYVMHQAFIYNKEVHAYAQYDTTYKINADYDLYLKMLSKGYDFLYGDAVVSNMRVDGSSYQAGLISAVESLHIHLKNKLPAFKSICLFHVKLLKLGLRGIMNSLHLGFLLNFYRKTKR